MLVVWLLVLVFWLIVDGEDRGVCACDLTDLLNTLANGLVWAEPRAKIAMSLQMFCIQSEKINFPPPNNPKPGTKSKEIRVNKLIFFLEIYWPEPSCMFGWLNCNHWFLPLRCKINRREVDDYFFLFRSGRKTININSSLDKEII